MTRDYVAYGERLENGIPFSGWSFRVSGLEKLPIIKWVAKSASMDHQYSGKETRSWQFEGVSPSNMNFFKFGSFADDYKEYERNSKIQTGFSPLIGLNMTMKKGISMNIRHNRDKSLEEQPSGLTIRQNWSITSSTTYSHRGGLRIPIPYYGDLNLNNTVNFTLNLDMNDSKEFKSGDKINLEEGAFSSSWKAGLRVTYQFSTKVSGSVIYEYRENENKTTGKKIDRDFGFDVNMSISG
jgi:cell surface protein SprA